MTTFGGPASAPQPRRHHGGRAGHDQPVRRRRFRTVLSCQAPPRAVRTVAMARNVVAPAACIWRTMGSTLAAKASAACRSAEPGDGFPLGFAARSTGRTMSWGKSDGAIYFTDSWTGPTVAVGALPRIWAGATFRIGSSSSSSGKRHPSRRRARICPGGGWVQRSLRQRLFVREAHIGACNATLRESGTGTPRRLRSSASIAAAALLSR
jgi:hypothetical protein